MSERAAEISEPHSRLLKCALEIEESRAYWERATPGESASVREAFDGYWFGAKSEERVQVLLFNFRYRFDLYPEALRVLHTWRHMEPGTRALICHWHTQLSDPLYRSFTGSYLVERREALKPEVTRDRVVSWLNEHAPAHWTTATRIQFASKALSAAHRAGLVASTRDPRPLLFPRTDNLALTYLLYLLRGTTFAGTLLDNPYLRSVGLEGETLEARLVGLEALRFVRQGPLVDFGWRYTDLEGWAALLALPKEGAA